jgi:hypothetical protein
MGGYPSNHRGRCDGRIFRSPICCRLQALLHNCHSSNRRSIPKRYPKYRTDQKHWAGGCRPEPSVWHPICSRNHRNRRCSTRSRRPTNVTNVSRHVPRTPTPPRLAGGKDRRHMAMPTLAGVICCSASRYRPSRRSSLRRRLDRAMFAKIQDAATPNPDLVFRRSDYDSLSDGVGYDFAIFTRA